MSPYISRGRLTRAACLAAAVLLSSAPRARADFRTTEDVQYWTPTFLHAPRYGRLSGLLEINPRVRGDFGRLSHLLVRPWIGWSVTPALTTHVGYSWVRNDLARVTEEHRAWEQATLQGSSGKFVLIARGRLEQRWLEGLQGAAHRGRIMGRVERTFSNGPWYAAASNELFVHMSSPKGGPVEGLDQNRLYFGLGRRGAGRRRMEGGYQHWWIRRPAARDSVFHVLVLTTHWAHDS